MTTGWCRFKPLDNMFALSLKTVRQPVDKANFDSLSDLSSCYLFSLLPPFFLASFEINY